MYLAPGYLLFIREDVLLAQALDLARLELTGDPVSIADRVASSVPRTLPAASASNPGTSSIAGADRQRAPADVARSVRQDREAGRESR